MAGLERETLGRYEILGILGVGGMGEVYRARDTPAKPNGHLQCRPQDATVIAIMASVWEDLGYRNRALDWFERAFQQGVSPICFESRPHRAGWWWMSGIEPWSKKPEQWKNGGMQ